MRICSPVIDIIEIILRVLVRVITFVIRTVCEWVSSITSFIKEVCNWVEEEICSNLPWPLSWLCRAVTNLVCVPVEFFERIWDWVCREVLERIITFLERFVTILIYVLRWVCWLLDFIVFRWWLILLCRAGILSSTRTIAVCPVILRDEDGNAAATIEQVTTWLVELSRIYVQCNIRFVFDDIRIVTTEYANGSSCNFGGIFSGFFNWFSMNANTGCVTLYLVSDIDGACGCAYPGANWVTVSAATGGCTEGSVPCVMAQELGHLFGLYTHSDTAENVMANPCGTSFTRWQCCMIRTSRFVSSATTRLISGPFRDLTHSD